MNGKFYANTNRQDESNGWNSAEFDTDQTHETKHLEGDHT